MCTYFRGDCVTIHSGRMYVQYTHSILRTPLPFSLSFSIRTRLYWARKQSQRSNTVMANAKINGKNSVPISLLIAGVCCHRSCLRVFYVRRISKGCFVVRLCAAAVFIVRERKKIVFLRVISALEASAIFFLLVRIISGAIRANEIRFGRCGKNARYAFDGGKIKRRIFVCAVCVLV